MTLVHFQGHSDLGVSIWIVAVNCMGTPEGEQTLWQVGAHLKLFS